MKLFKKICLVIKIYICINLIFYVLIGNFTHGLFTSMQLVPTIYFSVQYFTIFFFYYYFVTVITFN